MDQEIQVQGRSEGYDGTGPYWVIGQILILKGSVSFLVDGKEVKAPSDSFVMVMLKNSVVSVFAEDATTINRAVFSRAVMVSSMPKSPIVFPARHEEILREPALIEAALEQERGGVEISRTRFPHPATVKIKDYLGSHFERDVSLTELADEAQMTPEALSRAFKRDWGKSPIQFRNWLRIMDSFRYIAE